MVKKDIRALTVEQLAQLFQEINEPAFRAKQVYDWLWAKSAVNFDQMSNLSKNLRDYLNTNFAINAVQISELQVSSDRTIKCAMRLHDNYVVESVLIPHQTRFTACISSQVGCSLTCKFCATGKLKRMRNLNADEIYDQVVLVKNTAMERYNAPLTNIVYMGMGEPLLNYNEVLSSVEKITSPKGLGMAAKRITVSTAGVAKMIAKLADDNVKFHLALSLHAASDEKRNHIMPINETNSLENLAQSLNYFIDKTGTRPTFEYIAFKDYNDSISDAQDLVNFCKKVKSKVNIIEYNPIDDGEFKQTTRERLKAFTDHLEKNGIICNVRHSRGKDIDAACGQLANKNKLAMEQLK
ncbi:MAG: 23S rRNA (adenine(2503)-C(2))-methyltransferase RlmN [Bacteroidota bacterium]|nr:23S rRNA (adenine(2503)-C(2))-methyltransferase RlmN [Bacteroidota bacterium]MDP3146284.1 23S rRNA (adenine(2503)-C(2))-methyltransferase RlmN [Bacteroidota bacterium]MDP3556390.1 23S rRNA (adenine(2503)-C(2))-methyltransferase RlmN [Bacteroidota bacterium]